MGWSGGKVGRKVFRQGEANTRRLKGGNEDVIVWRDKIKWSANRRQCQGLVRPPGWAVSSQRRERGSRNCWGRPSSSTLQAKLSPGRTSHVNWRHTACFLLSVPVLNKLYSDIILIYLTHKWSQVKGISSWKPNSKFSCCWPPDMNWRPCLLWRILTNRNFTSLVSNTKVVEKLLKDVTMKTKVWYEEF